MERIGLAVIGIVLAVQAVFDIKWKKIPIIVTGIGAVSGGVILFFKEVSAIEVLLALLPGLCCLLYSKVSRQALGYGDAFLLCIMGLFFSMEDMMLLILAAFGMGGIMALALLLCFRKQRKYEIPFVPFLLAAYGVVVWIRIGSGGL